MSEEAKNSLSIERVASQLVAIEKIAEADLANREVAEQFVAAAVMANELSKKSKEQDDKVKTEFKRIMKDHIDKNDKVVCYSWTDGKKVTITYSGGGGSISEEDILKELCARYGEEPGDMTGRAWQAFMAITDPAPMPRVLNPDKLAAELKRSERIRAGVEDGTPYVTPELVERSTIIKKPSVVCKVSDISKAEMKRHNEDGFSDCLVVG